jgi:PHP family Zn ribbon phosphoesterase
MFSSFSQKSHFDIRYTDPKKENFTDLLYRAYLDTSDILRIFPHMAKRKYNGCELLSPLYRQIAAEMARNKKKTVVINEYKPKRGKRS